MDRSLFGDISTPIKVDDTVQHVKDQQSRQEQIEDISMINQNISNRDEDKVFKII